MALGFAHHVRVAILPDAALPQQPVRGQPRAAEQQRRPPGVRGEHGHGRKPGQEFHQAGGDEVHGNRQRRAADAEVEIPRHRDVVGEFRVFQMRHARRLDAGDGEAVVQPSSGLKSEVRAHRLMQRRKQLLQHEHHGHRRKRQRQPFLRLHGADQRPHDDGEQRRQQPAQHQHDPPQRSQQRIGLAQHADELPLLFHARGAPSCDARQRAFAAGKSQRCGTAQRSRKGAAKVNASKRRRA